jgi:hypothetical protein
VKFRLIVDIGLEEADPLRRSRDILEAEYLTRKFDETNRVRDRN